MKNSMKMRLMAALLALCSIVSVLSPALVHAAGDEDGPTPLCGMIEHTHTDACYRYYVRGELLCELEPEMKHVHDESCYEEKEVLVCGKPELGHHHDESCGMETVLACGYEEAPLAETELADAEDAGADDAAETQGEETPPEQGHVHSEDCYEVVYSCGMSESAPDDENYHRHDESCYEIQSVLTCDKEFDTHEHTDECYEMRAVYSETPVCGLEEHEHTPACFGVSRAARAPQAPADYTLQIPHQIYGEQATEVKFNVALPDGVELNKEVTMTGSGMVEIGLNFAQSGTYEVAVSMEPSGSDAYRTDERTMYITLTATVNADNTVSVTKGEPSFKIGSTVTGEQDAFVTIYKAPQIWPDETIAQAEKIMADMTLEEKVGQMFLVHYPGDGSGSIAQANEVIDTYHPGGFLVFGAMFKNSDPATVQAKTSAAQQRSEIPMIFSVDEEGGTVVRISSNSAFGHSKFQSQMDVAAGGVNAVYADAAEKANFLLNLGLNVNHAPVGDVSGASGYIYKRTYGGNGLYNAQFVTAAVQGHENNGVGTTIKHFPGYGGTGSNTHNGFAINDLSLDELKYNDLLPFIAAFHAGGKGVMVTHNIFPCLDGEMPASLSPAVIGYLRNELGYDGLVTTDDLNMGAITQSVGDGYASLTCIKAGVDMPMTNNYAKDIPIVINAVRSGELSEERINESCRRVLCWKIELGIMEREIKPVDPPQEEVEAVWSKAGAETKSGRFEDMWAYAATHGGTVTLMVDINTPGDKTVSSQNIKLNLNGHKLHFTSGTNGFIIQNNCTFTLNDESLDGVKNEPIIEDTLNPAYKEAAAYNSVRNELVYYTYAKDGTTMTRHDVNFDMCGQVSGANTGIMVEVTRGQFVMNGGVLSHKVRAVETTTNSSNVININGGAIVNCGVAQGGTTVNGSGVGIFGGGTLNITGGYIAGCSAKTRGAAVYVDTGGGKVNMSGGVLAANTIGTNGGSVYLNTSGTFNMSGGVIASNHCGANGGGIYGINAKINITGGTLSDNDSGGTGGGVFNYGGSASITVKNALVTGNRAATNGGGICQDTSGTSITVDNTTFAGNAANGQGGAIYANRSSTTGTAMKVSVTNSEIRGNSANIGGAIVFNGTTELTLTNVAIQNNTAKSKAGGVHYNGSSLSLNGKVYIRNNTTNGTADNLHFVSGKVATLPSSENLTNSSFIGVTTESLPVDNGVVNIARSTNTTIAQENTDYFRSDRPAYHCKTNNAYVVLAEGEAQNVNEILFDGILFQYYANVTRIAATGDASRRLEIIDTTGGVLPQNGVKPQVRYLYLNEDGSVMYNSELLPVYRNEDIVDADVYDIDNLNKFNNTKDYYQVSEIWVAPTGQNAKSVDRADWEIYPYDEFLSFTTGDVVEGASQIHIEQGYAVRYVAETQPGNSSVDATFYDYDVSDGKMYASFDDAMAEENAASVTETDTWVSQGKPAWMNVANKGINSLDNYDDPTKPRLAFGNQSLAGSAGLDSVEGFSFNMANRGTNNFKFCSFGLVTGLDENGNLIYNPKISAPNLFDDGDAVGKTRISGYSLDFSRQGEVYTLKSVSGTSLTDLDTFGHPGIYDGVQNKTVIWTNNFWPLDEMGTFGTEGHDMKYGNFKNKSLKNKAGYAVGTSKANAILAESDDYLDHNGFFGMHFSIKFNLEPDYCGPMEYVFFGDDDMWAFMDGELISDIGGVHTSAGSYTNLWDYLDEGEAGEHELEFFFTERGASGSTCWMQLNVPHLRPDSEDAPAFPGSLKVSKTVENIETDQEFEFEVQFDFADANGAVIPDRFKYTGSKQGNIKSGDTIKLANGEFVLIQGLPAGTTYAVTEKDAKDFHVSSSGAAGTIDNGQSNADFVNTFVPSGSLVISKTVQWQEPKTAGEPRASLPGTDNEFTFTVELKDADGRVLPDEFHYTGAKTGTLHSGDVIRLSDGESIEILDIPENTVWAVTEADADGFDHVGNAEMAGTITADETTNASFVNRETLRFDHTMPKAGGLGLLRYSMSGLFMLGAAFLLWESRKRNKAAS